MARANTSLDCCVRATSTEAQMRDNSVLTLRFCRVDRFRRRNRCGSLRLSSSTAIEQPASAVIPHSAGDDGPVRIVATGPLEADVVRAGCPADRAAFRTAKLRINADNPGSGTTTR